MISMIKIRPTINVAARFAVLAIACLLLPVGLWAQYNMAVTQETVSRVSESDLAKPALTLTDAQRKALVDAYHARREAMDTANNKNEKPGNSAEAESAPTREATFDDRFLEGDFHLPPVVGISPGSNYIGRNNLNPQANTGLGSTLAETSAHNEGPNIFYTGNTHAEYSINGGITYTNVAIPAGPGTAPFACCDNDNIYDKARGVTIWNTLYLNAGATQGTVRIFVRRNIPSANNCAYDITPGVGVVPDYPHFGLTNDFLYLTTNEGATHRIRRFNLDQMVDCVGVATTTIAVTPAVGQRVVVPVEGATDTMYWAYHENATTLRIFSWPETLAAPAASVLKAVALHNHLNPVCKGGLNNTDWIERSTSFTITGFRMRGAVGGGKLGFWWNVSSDLALGHNQAHVHAAVFQTVAGFPTVGQPHIIDSTRCVGYPAVGVNQRGDFGLIVGRGGNSVGGVAVDPVRPYWGIDDDYTVGSGVVTVFTLFAPGTHNPPGAGLDPPRWGDYHSVRQHQPCGMAWTGTAYTHNGGTTVGTINARYIEFMRARDFQCYVQWRDEVPDLP